MFNHRAITRAAAELAFTSTIRAREEESEKMLAKFHVDEKITIALHDAFTAVKKEEVMDRIKKAKKPVDQARIEIEPLERAMDELRVYLKAEPAPGRGQIAL